MKDYKNCPLKKRPVFFEYEQPAAASTEEEYQPQDLSIKRKAEDECKSEEKRHYALNLTVHSVYESPRDLTTETRTESPISMYSETSQNYNLDNSLSPPSSERDYPNIHLRGMSPNNIGFNTHHNPMTAVWNNNVIYNLTRLAMPSAPVPVFNSNMTPPSSPGSYSSSSEPEDLSVRNDIPLPALFHMFDQAPSATGIPPYNCNKCNKRYSTEMGLNKHMQFHCPVIGPNREKKTHSCKECGKTYTSMGALNLHVRTHTLPCKCPICGKAFSRPWLLQGHIRTHTGEKPFSCTDCDRSFADRSNLRAHAQIHVQVKRYACKVCNKSFSRISQLNRHAISDCTITIV